jgi:hypothetical protein
LVELRVMKSTSMIEIAKVITAATLLAFSLPLGGATNPQSSSGPGHAQLRRPESAFVGSGDDTTASDPEEAGRNEAALKEREFVHRFNNLFSALLDFAHSYNAGHVIDVKRAKAVRKALRELEKAEWFNPRKSD